MGLKSEVLGGVKWTTVSTVTQATAALLKLSILARYLEKSDFGLMALVMFILGFMQLFMDMGLSTAILHKQEISRKEYASLYWINFIFSLVLYLIIVGLAFPIAAFYEEPELTGLLPVMGLSLILFAIGRQYSTIEQKNLNFKLIALVIIVASIISLALAVVLAINGYGVWSLVYAALLQHVITNGTFFVTGVRKTGLLFHMNFTEAKPFLRIGIYHVGGQMVNYFNRDLDILLIGKFFGSEILGGYSLAKQLVFKPFKMVSPVLNRVAAPVLAKFQENKNQLKVNYLKLLNGFSSVIIPVYVGLIVFANPLVHLFYGDGFDDIVVLVQILSVYMMFRSIGNPLGSLIVATGRTDLEFTWNLLTLIVMPFAVVIGSQLSIEWVAGCLTIAMVIMFVPCWKFLVRRMINVQLFTYIYWLIPGVSLLNKSK